MQQVKQIQPIDRFVGSSEWTTSMRQRIEQVANFRYNVLVVGPSGTGKELVARAIHEHSDRCDRPFIPVNCAAIPSSLFCSQLFGHVKGAFTGAQHASLGCFRAADGGTLFLDEIGDLDLENQAKLLRVLQERRVTPVGGVEDVPVDVRTIAATNRDLAQEVQAGRFRLDLYYRLNVLSLETLALAGRPVDIRPLAEHFLAQAALESGLPLKTLTPEAVRALRGYAWPGNVRELQNVVERVVVMSDGDCIRASDILAVLSSSQVVRPTVMAGGLVADRLAAHDEQATVENSATPRTPPWQPKIVVSDVDRDLAECDVAERDVAERDVAGSDLEENKADGSPGHVQPCTGIAGTTRAEEGDAWDDEWLTLAEMECQHIRRTLRRTYFNQSAAARLLGVDRKMLGRKIKKYGIRLPRRGAELSRG